MFIELTDHLRCPEPHDEQYLVLLPDRIEERSVRAGSLGCPACGRTFELRDGVLDVGGTPPAGEPSELEPAALAALVGLGGPGGYLVLVGAEGARWRDWAGAVPGVGLVALDPPVGTVDEPGISVLRGDMIPLKASSVRGVVLGAPFGGDPRWVAEAARVTLPGLRIVGAGPDPDPDVVELMASAGGWWVGSKARSRGAGPKR